MNKTEIEKIKEQVFKYCGDEIDDATVLLFSKCEYCKEYFDEEHLGVKHASNNDTDCSCRHCCNKCV